MKKKEREVREAGAVLGKKQNEALLIGYVMQREDMQIRWDSLRRNHPRLIPWVKVFPHLLPHYYYSLPRPIRAVRATMVLGGITLGLAIVCGPLHMHDFAWALRAAYFCVLWLLLRVTGLGERGPIDWVRWREIIGFGPA